MSDETDCSPDLPQVSEISDDPERLLKGFFFLLLAQRPIVAYFIFNRDMTNLMQDLLHCSLII